MLQPFGNTSAKILIVGEFATDTDLHGNRPFAGARGFELNKMLEEAGIQPRDCLFTYVVNDRVAGNNIDSLVAPTKAKAGVGDVLREGKYVTPQVLKGIDALSALIETMRPNIVITMGNLALYALTGEWASTLWRSSILSAKIAHKPKVLPTYGLSLVMMQYSLRPIFIHDLKRAKRQSLAPEIARKHYEFTIRPDFATAVSTLTGLVERSVQARQAGNSFPLGADIETRAGHIACIAFAWSGTEAICIPLMCQHSDEGYWSLEEEVELVMLIQQLLRHAKIVGQNWNYDAQYIYRHWHIIAPDVEDTMIQHHSCFSNLEKNLAFLSSMYLDDHLYWKDDRTNWETGPKGEGEDVYWRYNCTDAARTLAINEVLTKVIAALGMGGVNAFQQKLAPAVLQSMIRGVKLDREAQGQLSLTIQQEIADREQWFLDVLGHPLNINSPPQMKDFFYRQMGQKEVISRKTKKVTCNDEALHKIADREPILQPITRKIAELRSLGVFHSTFVMASVDVDSRIRTMFNVCGTETYRFSSTKNAFGSGLNMQNIPKGGETEDDGLSLPNVRNLYVPDFGKTMFDIDLDSADLRIVTWESGCEWMKDHFRNGRKPYIEVMREYYHNPSMTKSSHPREYAMFKSLCHGTNYLGTAEGIAPRIGLNVHETQRIQKWYFDLCPEIRKWQDDIKSQVSSNRCVKNVFGYKTYFFDRIEGTIFNQAVAWIPQSTVACLINRAYVNIMETLPDVEVLLQVHDSLVGQFDTFRKEKAIADIVKCSEIPLPYAGEPLVIPVGIATSDKSWGDCR